VWKDNLQEAFDHVTRLSLAVRAMCADLLTTGEENLKSMCEKALTIAKEIPDVVPSFS
jgi:hypothetical protein